MSSNNEKINRTYTELHLGETPITDAPSVALGDGLHCIPQHYLRYQHCRESVERLIVDIEYWPGFIIFVDEDQTGLYLQVAVISRDNYPSSNYGVNEHIAVGGKQGATTHSTSSNKLVYGRKWRVEPELPTSEVIQTAFLALKTAREHEVRELLRLEYQGVTTTPFNNHHDLPVMARQLATKTKPLQRCVESDLAQCSEQHRVQIISDTLAALSYDGARLKLWRRSEEQTGIEQRPSGVWLLDIALIASEETLLPELCTAISVSGTDQQLSSALNSISSSTLSGSPSNICCLTLVLSRLSINYLYFQLMQALLDLRQPLKTNFY